MASRTKLKEQARAQRLAQEQARAAEQRRTRRLQMLGGTIAVAIVVIVVAIVISTSGGGSAGLARGPQASKAAAAVQSMLSGIPQSGSTIGSPSAPVKVTYYGDLECPVCKAFTLGSDGGGWPQFVASDIRSGKVQVTYSGLETATPDPQTFQTQQLAALAAGLQGKFWQYAELFYHEQGQEGSRYVTEAYLDGLARQVPGLNYAKWLSDRRNPSLLGEVQSQEAAATAAGVTGTPTLAFTGPKGKTAPTSAIPSYVELQKALQQVS